MKNKSVKTYIIKLLRRYPKKKRYELLAQDLGITSRYVRYLENGQPCGNALSRIIKMMLDK